MADRKLLIYLFMLVLCYLASTGVRYHQHVSILNSPDHNINGKTILTTHDGYHWIRYSKDYLSGDYKGGKDKLSGFPEQSNMMPHLPLLSLFTAEISRISGKSLEESGSLMAVFGSGLFIFPLGILLYLMGYPAAGVGAGITCGISLAYLSRTSAFQIDTDMLNIFFMSAGSLFAWLSVNRKNLIYPILAGLTMYLFWRWYFHSGFTVIYFLLIVAGMYKKIDYRKLALFFLFTSPFVFVNGIKSLYEFVFGVSGVDYSVFTSIAELQPLGFEGLSLFSASPHLAFVGILMSIVLRKNLIYLLPFYLLGLMMFFKGERFAMFLAPVIGAGFGLFFHYLFMKFRYRRVLSCGAVFAFVVLFSAKPFLWVVPAPVVDKDVYAYIASINGKLEKDSLIASWWDNGFLIQYLTGYAVFTDGASQGRLGTKLVADLIARRDVQSVLDVSGIRPVYMLLTSDMFNYADSIFKASGFSDIDGEIFSRSMFSHFVIGDSDMIKWHSKTVEFPSGKLYKLK